jgi:hypothetical protein
VLCDRQTDSNKDTSSALLLPCPGQEAGPLPPTERFDLMTLSHEAMPPPCLQSDRPTTYTKPTNNNEQNNTTRTNRHTQALVSVSLSQLATRVLGVEKSHHVCVRARVRACALPLVTSCSKKNFDSPNAGLRSFIQMAVSLYLIINHQPTCMHGSSRTLGLQI